jgi:alpha-L-fucosidase
MPRIGKMARKHQPGILVVDRWVPTIWENYHTPEQEIPEKPLPYPWETCMTWAGSWSYVPNDSYKPTEKIIHNLVRIVSSGGNYLLNVAPGPDGDWHAEAYERMKEVGAWMKINGEGIYYTRPYAPHGTQIPNVTKSKNGKNIFVFRLVNSGNATGTIEVPVLGTNSIQTVQLLGSTKKVKWSIKDAVVYIEPETTPPAHPGYAHCYKIILK